MIQTKNLVKTFKDGDAETRVLKGIDFRADQGQFIVIMGRSGSGKSTFLYQMSLLDTPTSGQIIIDGRDTATFKPEERIAFRLTQCGYVFQDYALLPELSAVENVALPLLMQGLTKKKAYDTAKTALTKVGLAHRFDNLPSHLSGGEQQRTSIARAISHRPKILFADEPTANLDNESSKAVLDIFQALQKEGQTIIMVTHEEQYAKLAQKIIKLDDGKIVNEISNYSN